MKKFFLSLIILTAFGFCLNTTLAGIALKDPFAKVVEKYPQFGKWENLELISKPYPANVLDHTPAYLAQSEKLDVLCYFTAEKKVMAVAAYYYDKDDGGIYETAEGLRPGDGPIEMKLLYGNPAEVSEYKYLDENKLDTVRRIYYYPSLCIHTRQQENLPEFIESIVLTEYDIPSVINSKDKPAIPGTTKI